MGQSPFWSLNTANRRPVESCLYSFFGDDQSMERKVSSDSMAYYTPIMSAHFKEKHHWSEDTFLSIDWPSSDKEYKDSPQDVG